MNSHQKDIFVDVVKKDLDTEIIGKNIKHFKKIDSTNKFIKNLEKNHTDDGLIVVSDTQLSGRGREDRTWSSPEGGLWFSVLLYPNIAPDKGMLITMASSVAVVKAIKDLTGLDSEIKWPNDVLIKNKKVCGILTEIENKKNKQTYFVVGIGINVNNEIEKNLQKSAISLREVFNAQISRTEFLRLIIKNLEINYKILSSGDYENIRNMWLSNTRIIGKKIRVEDGKNQLKGVVLNIDESGFLYLETESGPVKIVSGDVIYI